MKKFFYLASLSLSSFLSLSLFSCKNDDENVLNEPWWHHVTIEFKDVPENLIASNEYGSNLYYGASNQITTGYITQLFGVRYVQFPVNYGLTFDESYNPVWGYSFFQGGFAVSKYHNMTDASYENQLSVYDQTSPGGGNFIVAFGASKVTNPDSATLADYDECAHMYITDPKGYFVEDPGTPGSHVDGEESEAYIESVWINNTTYTYFAMKNGNDYASALNEENKGWFKVQFIAFDDDDLDSKPVGYTEAYLANFDEKQAGGYMGIIDEWIEVDLSDLPYCSILVINFVGSDTNEWGLKTPTYCALDKFNFTVCP